MAPAGEEQQPLQAPAPLASMQGRETLRSPHRTGDISLDMQSLYSKRSQPFLGHNGPLKSLRMGPCPVLIKLAPLQAVPVHASIAVWPGHGVPPSRELTSLVYP